MASSNPVHVFGLIYGTLWISLHHRPSVGTSCQPCSRCPWLVLQRKRYSRVSNEEERRRGITDTFSVPSETSTWIKKSSAFRVKGTKISNSRVNGYPLETLADVDSVVPPYFEPSLLYSRCGAIYSDGCGCGVISYSSRVEVISPY